MWARIPQKKWSSPHIQQESLKCSTCDQSHKRQNINLLPRQIILHQVIRVYAPITNAEIEWFYEDLQGFLELTKKDVLFIIGDWNERVRSQEIHGVTDKLDLGVQWIRAKANRVLPRECHNKHPLPTTKETVLPVDITRWPIPKSDWFYSVQLKMEKLYTVSKNKTRSWLWLKSWVPYCKIQTYSEESRENH